VVVVVVVKPDAWAGLLQRGKANVAVALPLVVRRPRLKDRGHDEKTRRSIVCPLRLCLCVFVWCAGEGRGK